MNAITALNVESLNLALEKEGLSRATAERRMIELLENEGFDTLVELVWKSAQTQYAVAMYYDSLSAILDEVIGSG